MAAAFDLNTLAAELSLIHETECNTRLYDVGKKLYEDVVVPKLRSDVENFRADAKAGFAGRVVTTLTEPETKALRVYLDREKITLLKIREHELFLAWAADY